VEGKKNNNIYFYSMGDDDFREIKLNLEEPGEDLWTMREF
jgi:hypothetical protein